MKTVTMKEVLDIAEAAKTADGDPLAVEADLLLSVGHTSHRFLFDGHYKTKGRKFDHFTYCGDAWETISEERLMAMYGTAAWANVWKDE